MAWTTISYPFGSVLTSAKMGQNQDNFTAVAQGLSGAPKILTAAYNTASVDQAAIGASAVGQSELKSTTASQSQTIGAVGGGTTYTTTLTGGAYTMFWCSDCSAAADNLDLIGPHTFSGAYQAVVGLTTISAIISQTWRVYSRYVQASPPWNLGDGDIALFAMVLLDKTTQEVLATSVAKDPPWAYHGPHDLHPVNGKLLKAAGLWGTDIQAAVKDVNRQIIIDKMTDLKNIQNDPDLFEQAMKYEFPMSEKNIDIDIVPHLFSGIYDPANHIVAMLDPCGSLTDIFADLQDVDPSAGLSDLLIGGHLNISTAELATTRNPSGVIALPYGWKNTV